MEEEPLVHSDLQAEDFHPCEGKELHPLRALSWSELFPCRLHDAHTKHQLQLPHSTSMVTQHGKNVLFQGMVDRHQPVGNADGLEA